MSTVSAELVVARSFIQIASSDDKIGEHGRRRASDSCVEYSNLAHGSTDDKSSFTTVVIQKLPAKYTTATLVATLNEQGFANCYDLVYVPHDFKRAASRGFGFVNFLTHETAMRALSNFDGFVQWQVPGSKVGKTSWSSHGQGLAENIENLRNSRINQKDIPDEHRPFCFCNSVRVKFPEPTNRVRS